MPNLIMLRPNGDFETFDKWVFSPDYKGSYIYHVDKKVWYQWFPYADWIPVNDCDVPKEYLSRLRVIQLLL